MQNVKPNFAKPNIIIRISKTLFNIKKKYLPKFSPQFVYPKYISQRHNPSMYFQNLTNSKFILTNKYQGIVQVFKILKEIFNYTIPNKIFQVSKYFKT